MSATAFQRLRREQAAREAEQSAQEAKQREQAEKPIDKMTVPELKEYAELHSIDLGEAAKKDDIFKAIKAAETAKLAAEAEVARLAAEAELQELRTKASELGIEGVDTKDADALRADIAAKGSVDDGDK